jgi:hypothetical protein
MLTGDFYGFEELLSDDERATLHRVREFLRTEHRGVRVAGTAGAVAVGDGQDGQDRRVRLTPCALANSPTNPASPDLYRWFPARTASSTE